MTARGRSAAWLAACLMFSGGCSIRSPVEVVSGREVLCGHALSTVASGTFEVRNGLLACSGAYNPLDPSQLLVVPVRCDDGRTGMATVFRDRSRTAGTGTIILNDGDRGRFIFGSPASACVARPPAQ